MVTSGRPKAKKARQAWDAGVDYAQALIDSNPKSSAGQIQGMMQGCSLDLCGGDEVAADWAYDGGCAAIREHFAAKKD